jgi:hypothetical protein
MCMRPRTHARARARDAGATSVHGSADTITIAIVLGVPPNLGL